MEALKTLNAVAAPHFMGPSAKSKSTGTNRNGQCIVQLVITVIGSLDLNDREVNANRELEATVETILDKARA